MLQVIFWVYWVDLILVTKVALRQVPPYIRKVMLKVLDDV